MANIIAPGARLSATTLNSWIAKKIEPIFRQDYLLSEFKRRGLIGTNKGGSDVRWKPRFRRKTIEPITGYPTSGSYPTTNFWKEAVLPWRGYKMEEAIHKFEQLAQQSGGSAVKPVALINIVERITNIMSTDFMADLALKSFEDGNAGSGNELHGLESWFAVNGTISGKPVGVPNDSYAGLSTVLGNYGGSSDGWPDSTFDPEAAFWSPLVVDYQNSEFANASGTRTWAVTWRKAIRYLTTYLGIIQQKEPDVILMHPAQLRQAKDSLEDNDRFVVDTNPVGDTDVGFKRLTMEGTRFVTQYGMPSECAYALNFDSLQLWSMQANLVQTDTDEDITTSTKMLKLDSYLQMICESPAYQGKLADITALGT